MPKTISTASAEQTEIHSQHLCVSASASPVSGATGSNRVSCPCEFVSVCDCVCTDSSSCLTSGLKLLFLLHYTMSHTYTHTNTHTHTPGQDVTRHFYQYT